MDTAQATRHATCLLMGEYRHSGSSLFASGSAQVDRLAKGLREETHSLRRIAMSEQLLIAAQDTLDCAEGGNPIEPDDEETTYCGSVHRECLAAHVEHCEVCRD